MIDPIQLHALADNELSVQEAEALRREIENCPASKAEFRNIVIVKRAVREGCAVGQTEAAWVSCVGRLNEMDRARRVEGFVGRYAWALCGVFFVVILIGAQSRRVTRADAVNVADLSNIVTSLAAPRTPPVEARMRDRWLDQLLGQARQSVDPGRLTIVRHAFGQLEDRAVNLFTLRDANGNLALLVIPGVRTIEGSETLRLDREFRLGHLQGLNSVMWTDGTNTHVLAADRPYEDLVNAASVLTGR